MAHIGIEISQKRNAEGMREETEELSYLGNGTDRQRVTARALGHDGAGTEQTIYRGYTISAPETWSDEMVFEPGGDEIGIVRDVYAPGKTMRSRGMYTVSRGTIHVNERSESDFTEIDWEDGAQPVVRKNQQTGTLQMLAQTDHEWSMEGNDGLLGEGADGYQEVSTMLFPDQIITYVTSATRELHSQVSNNHTDLGVGIGPSSSSNIRHAASVSNKMWRPHNLAVEMEGKTHVVTGLYDADRRFVGIITDESYDVENTFGVGGHGINLNGRVPFIYHPYSYEVSADDTHMSVALAGQRYEVSDAEGLGRVLDVWSMTYPIETFRRALSVLGDGLGRDQTFYNVGIREKLTRGTGKNEPVSLEYELVFDNADGQTQVLSLPGQSEPMTSGGYASKAGLTVQIQPRSLRIPSETGYLEVGDVAGDYPAINVERTITDEAGERVMRLGLGRNSLHMELSEHDSEQDSDLRSTLDVTLHDVDL